MCLVGVRSIWIFVMGATLLCLLYALVETWRFPPVIFNPLDPVSDSCNFLSQ